MDKLIHTLILTLRSPMALQPLGLEKIYACRVSRKLLYVGLPSGRDPGRAIGSDFPLKEPGTRLNNDITVYLIMACAKLGICLVLHNLFLTLTNGQVRISRGLLPVP